MKKLSLKENFRKYNYEKAKGVGDYVFEAKKLINLTNGLLFLNNLYLLNVRNIIVSRAHKLCIVRSSCK